MGMTLKDVFDALGSGELFQNAVSENFTIRPSNFNRLIPLVNLGLINLFREFRLKIVEKEFTYVEDQVIYDLNTEGDFVEVLDLYYKGISLPRNSSPQFKYEWQAEYDAGMYFTLGNSGTIKIGKGIVSDFTVAYKALHPKIELIAESEFATTNAEDILIDLPYAYLNALVYFISHKISTSLDAQSVATKNPFNVGNNYLGLYKNEVDLLKLQSYEVDQPLQSNKFFDSGFV